MHKLCIKITICIMLICGLARMANADNKSLRRAIKQFTKDADIEALEDRLKKIGISCVISEKDEDTFHKDITELEGIQSRIEYLEDYCESQQVEEDEDTDLYLDALECKEFKNAIKDTKGMKGLKKYVQDFLDDIEYNIKFIKGASSLTHNVIIQGIAKSDSCHIPTILKGLGQVSKRHVMSRITTSIREVISSYWPGRVYADRKVMQKMKEKVDQEISKVFNTKDHDEHTNKISQAEKECYINKKKQACEDLDTLKNAYILDYLGSIPLMLGAHNTPTREFVYIIAKSIGKLRNINILWLLNTFDTLSMIFITYPFIAMAIITVGIFFRTEIKTNFLLLASCSGYLSVPITAAGNLLKKTEGSLLTGLFFVITGGSIIWGINDGIIGISQGSMAAYGLICLHITIKEGGNKMLGPLLMLVPIIMYGAYTNLPESQKIHDITNLLPQKKWYEVSWFQKEKSFLDYLWMFIPSKIPHISGIYGLISTLSIVMLAAICENLGKKIYEFVNIRNSKLKDSTLAEVEHFSFIDMLMAAFGTNTYIIGAALAFTFICDYDNFYPIVTIIGCSFSIAMIYFHVRMQSDYFSAGLKASSVKSRTVEGLQGVTGITISRESVSAFNTFSIVMLSLSTGSTVLPLGWQPAMTLAGAAAFALYIRKDRVRQVLSWAVGLSFLFCGAIPYMLVGVVFLVCNIGMFFHFDFSHMTWSDDMSIPTVSA